MVVSTVTDMGTKPKRNSPTGRREKRLPEYARKIRGLRKECGLTQPELAAELHTRRGAIARWEAATREPNEQNYANLMGLARRRNLRILEDFFSNRLKAKERARAMELEDRDAVVFSRALDRMFKSAGAYANRLRELYRLTFSGYIREQINRISNAHKTLSNGAFSEEVSRVIEELVQAQELSAPGAWDAYRRLVALERQLERLRARAGEGSEIQQTERREIERMLDNWAALVREGKIPGPGSLEKALAENDLLRVLWAKVSRIAEEKREGDEKGKPLDPAELIKKLERTLGIDRKPGKSNGQI